jgi:nitroimidazol reductase NimA-like FMN-containing flavoprotein (pyridoxamine 5'-phosphate oxidase superfamily)
MLNVEDMPFAEMQALLQRVGFGHLGCAHNNRPYVVPIHYAYDSQDIYFFTTEGTKTEHIADNPEVCLQVEEVDDPAHWQSVMVNGRAERITEPEAMEHAMRLITERNPTLTPALNLTQLDSWGRANITAIYRVRPHTVDGRRTV